MEPEFETRVAAPDALNDWLARCCESLSLARTQIVIDQLRASLQTGSADQIVAVTIGDFRTSDLPLAAAIAILPVGWSTSADRTSPKPAGAFPLDAASIAHAGPVQPQAERWTTRLGSQLAARMDQELRQRGMRFLQWATDETGNPSSAVTTRWCQALGFQWLADLDYLSAAIPLDRFPDLERNTLGHNTANSADLPLPATPMRLRAEPLDWQAVDQWQSFAALVEQTYEETKDCPRLADFRSAAETLQGYRHASCFTPAWWFRLIDRRSDDTVGCLILAQHRKGQDFGDSASDEVKPADVAEIVYMGLVPQARRQGFGKELMQLAENLANSAGSSQLILAVDQANQPALSLYRGAGMQSVLRESIWVKSLTCVDSPT